MKKTARDLVAGDRIPPPSHERKWLRNTLCVVEVNQGLPDSLGSWVVVTAEFVSPYNPVNRSSAKFRFRPTTEVEIVEKPVQVLWCVNEDRVYPINVYEPAVQSELALSNVFATEAEARKKAVRP